MTFNRARLQEAVRRAGQLPGARTAPRLAAALHRLDPGYTLVVWKLDRLGRSVAEDAGLAEMLHAANVGVHILTGTLEGRYSATGGIMRAAAAKGRCRFGSRAS